MNRFSLKASALSFSFLLTACGGGGNTDSADVQAGQPTEDSAKQPDAPQQPRQPNQPQPNQPDQAQQPQEPDGVYLLAGSPTEQAVVDGSGLQARFNAISQIDSDGAGNIYVVDTGTIRKISPSGQVTTLAGAQGAYGYQDATGPDARFGERVDMAVAPDGTIYVWDTPYIRKVTQAGVVTTIAGQVDRGREDGPLAAARFNYIRSIEVDGAGNLYVEDSSGFAIVVRKISSEGMVSTVFTGCDGDQYVACDTLKVDSEGAIYYFQHRIPASAGSARGMNGPRTFKVSPDGTASDFGLPVSYADITYSRITDIDSRGNVYYYHLDQHGIMHACYPPCWEITRSAHFLKKVPPAGQTIVIEPFAIEDGERPQPITDPTGVTLPPLGSQPITVDDRGIIYYADGNFIGKVITKH